MWTRRRKPASLSFSLREIRMSDVIIRVLMFLLSQPITRGLAGRCSGASLSPQYLGGKARRIRSYVANARAT